MKKLFVIILCTCMVLTIHATTPEQFEFDYADQGVTIIYEEDTAFSNEKRQYIADQLVYGVTDDGISTYAWCWLTGHDLVSDSVIEVQHKVSSTVPRCYETTYEVITCTKCDHTETNKLSSVFIPCCPED